MDHIKKLVTPDADGDGEKLRKLRAQIAADEKDLKANEDLLKKLQAERIVGTNTTTIKKNIYQTKIVSKKEFDADYSENGGGDQNKNRVLSASDDAIKVQKEKVLRANAKIMDEKLKAENKQLKEYLDTISSSWKFQTMKSDYEKQIALQKDQDEKAKNQTCFSPKQEVSGTNRVALNEYIQNSSNQKIENYSRYQDLIEKLDYSPKLPTGNPPKSEAQEQQAIDLMVQTAAETHKYLLIKCFTGWGEGSVIHVNTYQAVTPNISYCEGLYPAGTTHSVDKLWTDIEGSV